MPETTAEDKAGIAGSDAVKFIQDFCSYLVLVLFLGALVALCIQATQVHPVIMVCTAAVLGFGLKAVLDRTP